MWDLYRTWNVGEPIRVSVKRSSDSTRNILEELDSVRRYTGIVDSSRASNINAAFNYDDSYRDNHHAELESIRP